MASAFVGIFLLLPLTLAVFFVAAMIVHRRRRREEAWHQVAGELNLQFFAGSWTNGPAIAGTVRGFSISVDTQGANEDRVTRYTVGYPSTGQQGIGLTKQSSFHFTLIKRLMAKNDVEIGDPDFDDRVLIDATDPVEAARYLSPVRRQAVLRLFAHQPFRDQKVTDTSVIVDTLGIESVPENLRATISALLDTAAIMSAPTDVDLAVETVETVETVEEPLPPQDRVVPDPEPEPDEPEPNRPEDDATRPEPDLSRVLDHGSVINDLFESGRMGFETDEHFQATYAGIPIRWTGTVDTIRDYRHDADFNGTGIKATLLVGAVGQSSLGSRMAKAVVQLPEGTPLERGQELTFEGVLVRADRFTRRVFIANGAVVIAEGTIHT